MADGLKLVNLLYRKMVTDLPELDSGLAYAALCAVVLLLSNDKEAMKALKEYCDG